MSKYRINIRRLVGFLSLRLGSWARAVSVCLLAAQVFIPAFASAAPIYVYKQSGGVIRFSSKPPPQGVQAEVFTAKGRYSTVGLMRRPSGRLFLEHFSELISSAARANQIEPSLVRAVIHVESGFNPRAVSPKGALGLMQLMPDTAVLRGVKKPLDPAQNIEGGTRHLAELIRHFNGDLRLALAAYNAGQGAVEQYGGVPPFRETVDYVDRVLTMKTRYKVALGPSGHQRVASS